METVVLDPGTHTVKAGFAGYNTPTDLAPSVVIPPVLSQLEGGTGDRDARHGAACIESGSVENLEDFEALLHYILYEKLGWPVGQEGNLLYAESLFTSKAEREDICQLMFEVFNVSGLFVCDQAVLSLYVCGKQNGCVVDMGHGKVDIAAVVDGQLHNPGMRRLTVSGTDQDKLLQELLAARGHTEGITPQFLQGLKEKICRVAPSEDDFRAQQSTAGTGAGAAIADGPDDQKQQRHRLPDGQEICLDIEGLRLGEALFSPAQVFGGDTPSLCETLCAGVMSGHEQSIRKLLSEQVLLCGGASRMHGAWDRLHQDARLHLPLNSGITQAVCPDYMPESWQKHAAWIGGTILAKVAFPQNHFMTRADYEERGPTAIHSKCG